MLTQKRKHSHPLTSEYVITNAFKFQFLKVIINFRDVNMLEKIKQIQQINFSE